MCKDKLVSYIFVRDASATTSIRVLADNVAFADASGQCYVITLTILNILNIELEIQT